MAIDFYVDSKFKDKQGRWRTASLFYESYMIKELPDYSPMYTLKDTEYQGLPSIKEAYLMYKDPTGYKVAKELLGGWEHWKVLTGLKWFNAHLKAWEEELEVSLKYEGIQKLLELSRGDKAIAKDAAKFIVNKEWEVKRGRPTKEDIEKQNRISSNVNNQIESDFKLLNLNEK